MPELPEVESIKVQLEKFLTGHTIVSIDVKDRKIFQGDEDKLIGGQILGTRRFGKVTVIDLSNGYSIITHVKLTGQFIYKGPNLTDSGTLSSKIIGGVPGSHTAVIFNLNNNGVLYYNDIRRFGWIRIVKTDDVESEPFIRKLGPEPFKDLTLEKFGEIVSKTSRNIKVVLMDQTRIGGIGNIYANDALWLAAINPRRPAKSLSPEEDKKLYRAVLHVLKEGIKYGGASELSFVTPDGKEGKYQNHTLVYGHEGEPCDRCHRARIEKYFLSGRGTYFCPVCQQAL